MSRVRARCILNLTYQGLVETCFESGPEGMGQLPWSRAQYRARRKQSGSQPSSLSCMGKSAKGGSEIRRTRTRLILHAPGGGMRISL